MSPINYLYKKLKPYAPPYISSDIIYLEEDIAAMSEVSSGDVDDKIYKNTVQESTHNV